IRRMTARSTTPLSSNRQMGHLIGRLASLRSNSRTAIDIQPLAAGVDSSGLFLSIAFLLIFKGNLDKVSLPKRSYSMRTRSLFTALLITTFLLPAFAQTSSKYPLEVSVFTTKPTPGSKGRSGTGKATLKEGTYY